MKRKFQFCFKIVRDGGHVSTSSFSSGTSSGTAPRVQNYLQTQQSLHIFKNEIYEMPYAFWHMFSWFLTKRWWELSIILKLLLFLTCYWWDLEILFTKQITGESLSCSYDSTEFTWKKTGEHESSLFLIFWFTDAEPGVCSLLRTGQSSPNQVEVLILLTPHK